LRQLAEGLEQASRFPGECRKKAVSRECLIRLGEFACRYLCHVQFPAARLLWVVDENGPFQAG
jgi:hypothetical protein